MRSVRRPLRLGLVPTVLGLLLATVGTNVATAGPTNATGGPDAASSDDTASPVVVPTTLTAEPVITSLGPLGSLRLFPTARLTVTETGEPLPQVSPGDPGREVVFSVNGKVVCTAYAIGGVASCQTPLAALAVIRGGGYDAHFAGFTYNWFLGYFDYLPSDAHGAFIG